MAATDRERALVEAGIALASELSLDPVLGKLAETAAELTGARYVALGVIDREHRRLRQFVTAGLTPEERARIGAEPTGRGILSVLISDARPLRLHAIEDDPRSVGFPEGHPPMRTFLGVPILLRGTAYGNLYLTEKADGEDFTADDEEIVQLLASQAAVAIENANRIERDALRRAVAAQELERKRLARELHDETGQALTSILLGLSTVEHAGDLDSARVAAGELRALVVATLQDVRRLAVELRPSALDDFGLEPALRRLGQTVRETSGLDVQVETRLGESRLPAEIETVVYRIVQEALTNVLKHARARRVSVVATRKDDGVSVVIEDDGRGFRPGASTAGLGLVGMRERVQLLDGAIEVESRPGAGTMVILELPLR